MSENKSFYHSPLLLERSVYLYKNAKELWLQIKSLFSFETECSPFITFDKTKNEFVLRNDDELLFNLLNDNKSEEIVIFPTTFEQFIHDNDSSHVVCDEYVSHSITNVLTDYLATLEGKKTNGSFALH